MRKKDLKTLAIRKESIVSLNNKFLGGALPTTKQDTVNSKQGDVCELTPAICPTNWFDC
jgi:hypothetical protein